jgi:hypothetical protein
MLERMIVSTMAVLAGPAMSKSVLENKQVRVWGVFILCFLSSALGVVLSFWLLGAAIKGYRLWGFGLVIAVTMLGVSYGAKYANEDARTKFTPVDLIQYLGQGFLWPSTWPALAHVLGIEQVAPPVQGLSLLDLSFRVAHWTCLSPWM